MPENCSRLTALRERYQRKKLIGRILDAIRHEIDYDLEECEVCQGRHLVDGKLCPECGGDGFIPVIRPKPEQIPDKLVDDVLGPPIKRGES